MRQRVLLPVAVALALGLAPAAGSVHADDPATVLPSDPSFVVTLTDNTRLEGKLGALRLDPNGTGNLTLVGPTSRTIAWLEVVKLVRQGGAGSPSEPATPIVILPGRDQLFAQIGSTDANSLELAPVVSPGRTVRIPLDRPLGLVLNPPTETGALPELIRALRDPDRAGEVLWLGNGDRKEGSFLGLDKDRLQFDSGAGQAGIDRSSVIALGFDPALVQDPEPRSPYLQLALGDGSRLGVTACRLERGQLQFTTRFGAEFSAPLTSLLTATVLNGTASYLADREPDAAQFVPFLDRHPRRFGRDLTWDGHPLRLGDVSYDRGLGTLPRTLLAYRLEPTDRRFQATLGQDARAGDLASVVFRVLVDRTEVYVSPPLTRRDPPVPIDVSTGGGRLLILVTEFGDRGDVQDCADWADARLIGSPAGSR